MTTRLDAALAAAERGWAVFPVRRGDKRPAVPAWEDHATTDLGTIHRAWEGRYSGANIGLACGPSGLVVIDLDVKPQWADGVTDGRDSFAQLCQEAGQPLPLETYTVGTPRGGVHLYYQAPEGSTIRSKAGDLAPLVDQRAGGGYVLASGSMVKGRLYEVLHDTAPAPLPTWLADRMTPKLYVPSPTPIPGQRGPRPHYADAALRKEVEQIGQAAEGLRNRTLNRAAFNLGQLVTAGDLDRAHTYTTLLNAAREAGLPATEAHATIRSGLTAGQARPRGACFRPEQSAPRVADGMRL